MKNGARSDHAATSPPTAGPLIPPSRKPPLNRPLARPRWLPGTVPRSRAWALMLNIAEPTPPLPRSTMSSTKDWENPARMLLAATTAMPAAITPGSPKRSTRRPAGSAPTTLISANTLITLAAAVTLTPNLRAKAGMAGATIPNPSATVNATAAEDRHFGGQIVERASSHATHETALCQLTRWYQSGHGVRKP